MAAALSADTSLAGKLDPLRLVRLDDLPNGVQQRLVSQGAQAGDLFSLDNRRLSAYKKSGIAANVEILSR